MRAGITVTALSTGDIQYGAPTDSIVRSAARDDYRARPADAKNAADEEDSDEADEADDDEADPDVEKAA